MKESEILDLKNIKVIKKENGLQRVLKDEVLQILEKS